MRKLFLTLVCCFAAAVAAADEFSITTILNEPIGIFDTLNTSGNTNLNIAEIGVRNWNTGVNPLPPGETTYQILQRQNLAVYGDATLSGGLTTGIWVNGSLRLEHWKASAVDPSQNEIPTTLFNIPSLTIYPNHYASMGWLSASTTLAAGIIHALGTIAIVPGGGMQPWACEYCPTQLANHIDVNGNPLSYLQAGRLEFTVALTGSTVNVPFPYHVNTATTGSGTENFYYGTTMKWDTNPASTYLYGPWTSGTASDTCPSSIKNPPIPTCTSVISGSCTQVDNVQHQSFGVNIDGGLYISRILGRRECRYDQTTDTCQMMGATADGQCLFDNCQYTFQPLEYLNLIDGLICPEADFSNTYDTGNPLINNLSARRDFCETILAGSNQGSGSGTDQSVMRSCILLKNAGHDPANPNFTTSGYHGRASGDRGTNPSPQHGVASENNCFRTPWPARSGLECSNVWEERWFSVATCGAKFGNVGSKIQIRRYRTVKCENATGYISPPTAFFVLEK